MLNYLHDGYTEEAYLKAEPGIHGEIRFSFRPFLLRDRAIALAAEEKQKPEDREAMRCKAIAERVFKWDVVDHAGKPVPIHQASAARLRPQLVTKIYFILMNLSASDRDPLASQEEQDARTELLLEAALKGTSPGEERETADTKN